MEIKKIKLICFSPTGTTKKVLQGIAKGVGIAGVEEFDLTLPEGAERAMPSFGPDELALIGAPVYGGRLPAEAIGRLKRLKAANTLAVPVVVYGNREFEDSLLELKNLSAELGFNPVAGAAFIGEHSFASAAMPVANGRPDEDDLKKAEAFGQAIKAKIAGLASSEAPISLDIPGRFPYEGGPKAMNVSPVTKEDVCILCGTCTNVCPTGAVSVDDKVTTQTELCIRCCACVKNCPTGARVWEDPMMAKITTWLVDNCSARKEPVLFGVEA